MSPRRTVIGASVCALWLLISSVGGPGAVAQTPEPWARRSRPRSRTRTWASTSARDRTRCPGCTSRVIPRRSWERLVAEAGFPITVIDRQPYSFPELDVWVSWYQVHES
jgi:hypothetical protein